MGNNGSPAEAFPLGACEGDCDSDDECAAGLRCFSRDGNEEVPGCVGPGESRTDYCYVPALTQDPTVSPSQSPSRKVSMYHDLHAALCIPVPHSDEKLYLFSLLIAHE